MITVNFLQFLFNYILAGLLTGFLAMKLAGTELGTAIAFVR